MGFPGKYVGERVGSADGEAVGRKEGTGVGAAVSTVIVLTLTVTAAEFDTTPVDVTKLATADVTTEVKDVS